MKRTLFMMGAAVGLVTLMSSTNAVSSEVSLADKGIPVTVDAPEGAVIEEGVGNGFEMDGVITHCWEINKGEFSLEVSMDDEEMWQEKSEYLSDSKEFAEMDEDFVEFVVEEENGFICSYNYEGEIEYDFYFIMVKDNQAIEFAPGLGLSDYGLENIRSLYNTAKSAK